MQYKQRQIILLAVDGLGVPKIAERLGLSQQTVRKILNSPLAKAEIKRILDEVEARTVDRLVADKLSEGHELEDAREIIESSAVEAARINRDLMRFGKSERIRQLSAWDTLNRAGFKAPDKVEQTSKVFIEGSLLDNLSEALKDVAGSPSGPMEEASASGGQ